VASKILAGETDVEVPVPGMLVIIQSSAVGVAAVGVAAAGVLGAVWVPPVLPEVDS
jgi:hypothetical protein